MMSLIPWTRPSFDENARCGPRPVMFYLPRVNSFGNERRAERYAEQKHGIGVISAALEISGQPNMRRARKDCR